MKQFWKRMWWKLSRAEYSYVNFAVRVRDGKLKKKEKKALWEELDAYFGQTAYLDVRFEAFSDDELFDILGKIAFKEDRHDRLISNLRKAFHLNKVVRQDILNVMEIVRDDIVTHHDIQQNHLVSDEAMREINLNELYSVSDGKNLGEVIDGKNQ